MNFSASINSKRKENGINTYSPKNTFRNIAKQSFMSEEILLMNNLLLFGLRYIKTFINSDQIFF